MPRPIAQEPQMRVGTAKDVATLIGASMNKVYQMAQTGEIPTLRRIGVSLRFDLDEVEQWMRKGQS